ncbi:MAG: bifunctional ADP-dependent NAD(P)H-hydrate dehydratase/NAD(P)H-hydrate epimerase, partial [Acidobacteria bacterium]
AESGRVVRVLLLCGPEELRGDAAAMFQRLSILPQVVRDAGALSSADAAPIFSADLIVDAILGTGFKPPVSPLYAAAISRMNGSAAPIIAVDIPSGADADAMQAQNGAIGRADAVVTFTAPRPAHIFAQLTSGPTLIAPIGSPPEVIVSSLGLNLSTPPDFSSPTRRQ